MTDIQLSPQELDVILRNDLMSFIERSFYELNPSTQFIAGKYLELLAATMERCRNGEVRRLIINLPPRTLKSHIASVVFPAWLLGHDSSKQILCVSYGQDLSDKHARDCRKLIKSELYRRLFPATVLATERLAVNDFSTTESGFRMATSVGGVVTGRGADFVILDDIQKPEEALSETRRNEAIDWYFNTLQSRLNSKGDGVIINVMQRLHEDDLVGAVLEREHWEILSLPAIALEDEYYPYGCLFGPRLFCRKAGEVLHPERDPLEVYNRIRESIGAYTFNSQYQQNPTPLEGGWIKREWIQFYEPEELPRQFYYVLQSWDTASKCGELNDYSVCTTWGLQDEKFYLIDVFRKRCDFPALKRAVLELFRKYEPEKVLIEDKSSGISLIQELKWEGVYCIEAYKPEPGRDKQMRFHDQSIRFEGKRVWLPRDAPWLNEYVREITGFPGTKFDDQADSTAQALQILGKVAGPLWGDYRGFGNPRVYETW